jgi:hypothetical protein
LDPAGLQATWRQALVEARAWIAQRPPAEAGCLYTDPRTGKLVAPAAGQPVAILRGQAGGVLPRINGVPARSFAESAELRAAVEGFFQKKLLP